jgi:hypothetical protein
MTEQGIQDLGVEDPVRMPNGLFGSERGPTEVCLAQHPFRNLRAGIASARDNNTANDRPASLVMVPRDMADHNMMRLYLMNGAGLDYVEPYENASNGYIRVWNVTER